MVVNKIRGTLNVAAVKLQALVIAAKRCLKILRSLPVANLFPRISAPSSKTLPSECGTGPPVTITKDDTTIVEGKGDPKAVSGRVESIKKQIEETDSDYDREKLQERLAKLAGGVAAFKSVRPLRLSSKRKKTPRSRTLSMLPRRS